MRYGKPSIKEKIHSLQKIQKQLLFVFSTDWIFFFEEKKVSLGKCFVSIVDSRCNVELLYNTVGKYNWVLTNVSFSRTILFHQKPKGEWWWMESDKAFTNVRKHYQIFFWVLVTQYTYLLFVSTARCSNRTRLLRLLSPVQSIQSNSLIAFEQSKLFRIDPVSYTHLTLPTNREV